ncbi:NADH oxidase [Termitomyces sp. T112]|nr:NADH oxidase [Termitomyces sp. T112]
MTQDVIFTPIKLPCGRTVNNRLVKVAMYEHLADFLGGPPNEHHYALYSNWADFGWGMIITGNVQVSDTHLSLGRDIILPKDLSKRNLQPFKCLATSMRGSGELGVLAIMQLSHTGRQSSNLIGGRFPFQPPLAPSSIRVVSKESGWISNAIHAFAFQQPTAMSVKDIDDVVEAFVKGARVAFESGFDGIQLHSAHGYLLAQFISPKSNKRQDSYSHPNNALRILHRIVSGIRSTTPEEFIIGIKLNAADYATHGDANAYDRVLDHFEAISQWKLVDFIEVSGGDYEKPDFMTRTNSYRQGFFSDFSKAAVGVLESLSLGTSSPLVLLTGGLRTPELLQTAIVSKHCHLLGIGRASVLNPNLPYLLAHQILNRSSDLSKNIWSTPFSADPDLNAWPRLRSYLPTIPLIGAGINMAWYIVAMRRLATIRLSSGHYREAFLQQDYTLGPVGAIFSMWVWIDGIYRPAFYLIVSVVIILVLILIS